ncbi:MAG: PHP domain-containing protein [Chloroflexia bacterium]
MSGKTAGPPTRWCDLHTHSTASDGRLTPEGVVEQAAALGLQALALTDHDTVAGLDAAWEAARKQGLTFIPGLELSTDWDDGECHILGYWLDYRAPALVEVLEHFRESRLERGRRMVERLQALGVPISWEWVQERARGGTVTRAHVAEALLEKGYVATRQEAFERYLGIGRPAYVARHKLSPEEAVRLVRRFHGVPVLAHPTSVEPGRDWTDDSRPLHPWPFLERLREAGLLGLEAYAGMGPPEASPRLVALAERYGLIVTGGSDFHGFAEDAGLGSVPVPPTAVQDLRRLARDCGSPWIGEFPKAPPP